MVEIKTPEHLESLLKSIQIEPKAQKKLNRDLANHVRKYFRGQIRKQRDIHNIPYAPKRRRKPMYITYYGKKIYRQSKDQRRNMLSGLSKMLFAQSDQDGFSVGLAGVPAIIAKTHNDGEAVTYTTRMNGWFNKNTKKWEGGRKSHFSYRMPKRTFIGWTTELEQQIAHSIMQYMEPET